MEWVEDILAVWGTAVGWWLGLCAAFLVLTKFTPCNPGRNWWADRRAAVTDFVYWLLLPFVTSVGRIAFLLIGVMLLYGRDTTAAEFAARGWPLWCQCLAILLVQDVLMYWIHRLFHRPALWRFHAVHHSPEVVDWTSAARFHPLNAVAEFALADAVILLMGFSPVALAVLGPVNLIVSAMVHANLNWTFGPFRHVLASPVFHRWHHTAEAEGLDKNFAPTFPFLDCLFGTFHMPKGRVPEVYGAVGETVPRGVLGQTVYPVRGAWAWSRRRPFAATTAVIATCWLGWFGWQKAVEFSAKDVPPQHEFAASAVPPPEPLRLSYGRGPALATAVAVNATSNRLVRGMSDGTVLILDATDGREIARRHHLTRVNAVALSPNGAVAVSVSGDGTVRVLDAATGAVARTLSHDGRNPICVAVSDNGWIATGTVDGGACLWDAGGALTKERNFGVGAVHAVALSDGGRVVATARHSRVSAWDTTTDAVTDFDGPRELVYAVAVRADGGAVVAGDYGGHLHCWDRVAAAPRFAEKQHAGPIYAIAFADGGHAVLTGGADRVVRVWDAKRGTVTRTFDASTSQLFAVSASVRGHHGLAASKESPATAWGTHADEILPASATTPGR
jgi:sterol desaturase/sphingolipid hydroxylase (fatty acid hydroxylase superfamily)